MRQGDGLLLAALVLITGFMIADGVTGGALASWAQQNVPGTAHQIGSVMGWIGAIAWPLLFAPLLLALASGFVTLPGGSTHSMRWTIKIAEAITGSVGGAARWFALGLVIATAVIVIQRYVFGYASTKLQESVIYMHALLFLLAAASTLLADGHVRVDIFIAKANARGRAWVDLLGTYLALFPMSALILWSSTGYMNSTWRILERSRESDGLPFVFLLKTAIPLFAILMILQGLAIAARAVLTLAGEEPPARPKNLGEGEV